MHQKVTSLLKGLLVDGTDASMMADLSRSTSLFTQDEPASAIYLIDKGLIKLTRTNSSGRVILAIYGPHHMVGEEALSREQTQYSAEAEVLSAATVHKIPSEILKRLMHTNAELSTALAQHFLDQKLGLMCRVELLCLRDVEFRVTYYLEELAKLVKPAEDGGHALPITQLELGELVGATRETTSTTLNHLEKKGFVKLSRRLLTVYLRHSRGTSA